MDILINVMLVIDRPRLIDYGITSLASWENITLVINMTKVGHKFKMYQLVYTVCTIFVNIYIIKGLKVAHCFCNISLCFVLSILLPKNFIEQA